MIDELGYLPLKQRGAHLFFQLAARRYERSSTFVTTNQLVTQWGAVFGDEVLGARDHRVDLRERVGEECVARLELRERRGGGDLGGELRAVAHGLERVEVRERGDVVEEAASG